MSNQIPLDGQSTCDEHMCNRNGRKPFLKCAQAHLMPRVPIFKLWHMQAFQQAHKLKKNLAWQLNYISNQAFPTHINNITYGKQVLDNLNRITPTVRTTSRIAPSCQILHGWYTSLPTMQPSISGRREID